MGEDQAEGWRHACALPPDSAQDTREAKITSAWRHSAPVVARLACPPLDADDESQPSPPRSALLMIEERGPDSASPGGQSSAAVDRHPTVGGVGAPAGAVPDVTALQLNADPAASQVPVSPGCIARTSTSRRPAWSRASRNRPGTS